MCSAFFNQYAWFGLSLLCYPVTAARPGLFSLPCLPKCFVCFFARGPASLLVCMLRTLRYNELNCSSSVYYVFVGWFVLFAVGVFLVCASSAPPLWVLCWSFALFSIRLFSPRFSTGFFTYFFLLCPVYLFHSSGAYWAVPCLFTSLLLRSLPPVSPSLSFRS